MNDSRCPHCDGELDLFELLNVVLTQRAAECTHMTLTPSPSCVYCMDCKDCGKHLPPNDMEGHVN